MKTMMILFCAILVGCDSTPCLHSHEEAYERIEAPVLVSVGNNIMVPIGGGEITHHKRIVCDEYAKAQ